MIIIELNKSAARAMDLLVLLAKSERPLTLSEIQIELGMPKSSTFSLVYTLVEKEFIEQNDRWFTLGLNAFTVGQSYASKMDLIQVARPYLTNIASMTGETAFLGKPINQKIVYIDKHIGTGDVVSTCELGVTNELYLTGLGKSVLATYTLSELQEYIDIAKPEKKTQNTLTTFDEFVEAKKQTFVRGFAEEKLESSETMHCVACCVKDAKGEVVGAISVAAPWYHMTEEKVVSIGNLVSDSALSISRKLGFQGQKLYS